MKKSAAEQPELEVGIIPTPATTAEPTSIVRVDVAEGMGPLLQWAQTPGLNVDAIKDMVQLFREERAYNAEREFNEAMAHFQSECPPVRHDATASFATKNGGRMNYSYATLAQIAKIVGPYLHKHGLSFAWDMAMDATMVTATCIVHHKGGHARKSTFTCAITKTEVQSPAQATKGAQTFAQRCSLISALGLTTTDTDTDGAGDENEMNIGPGQIQDLDSLILEVGADKKKFLDYFDVTRLEELTVSNYGPAVKMLEAKRNKS